MNWDLLVSFRIPGPGVPMGRPRFSRYGGARTPEKSRRYLWLVQAIQEKASHGLDLPIDKGVPVRVVISVVYKRPSGQYRKRDPGHALHHTKRPDLDNVCKSILDGLSGVWADDSQVCSLIASKRIGAIVDRKAKICDLDRVDVQIWTGDPLEEP